MPVRDTQITLVNKAFPSAGPALQCRLTDFGLELEFEECGTRGVESTGDDPSTPRVNARGREREWPTFRVLPAIWQPFRIPRGPDDTLWFERELSGIEPRQTLSASARLFTGWFTTRVTFDE